MTIKLDPKRSEFKTRKEYRFAIGKRNREIRKEPIVLVTAIVFAIVGTLTEANGPATISALIATPIIFTIIKKRMQAKASEDKNK
jgi:hypothetical protein